MLFSADSSLAGVVTGVGGGDGFSVGLGTREEALGGGVGAT